MVDKADIPFLSATELAALIQKREVSPVEATEAYLERIQRVDGKLGSYITVSGDHALQAAKAAEDEIASGGYRGPMHGIPYAVKDQFNTRGILTTGGSSILSDFVPDDDATVIANLDRAGAILLGKLNMSEFAMGTAVRPPLRRAPQPLGPGAEPRHLQQWLRRGHCRLPVRHLPGRGHGGLHPRAGRLLRRRGPQAQLRPSQPPRHDRRRLVHGHGGAHLPDRRGLRHNPGGHRRPRPQRPLHLGRPRCPTTWPPWTAASRA